MPRAGLNRAAVVEAAAKLADTEGLASVTFARLAAELKVRPPSLYNHVEGMAGLLDAISALAFQELTDRSRWALIGRSKWDALTALARTQRHYAASHPGRFEATLRSLHRRGAEGTDVADAYLGLFLTALSGFGLQGDDALHTVRCLRAAVSGFIELERRGGFGTALNIDESFERLLAMMKISIESLEAGLTVAS